MFATQAQTHVLTGGQKSEIPQEEQRLAPGSLNGPIHLCDRSCVGGLGGSDGPGEVRWGHPLAPASLETEVSDSWTAGVD